ncbi:hypothetical protein [Dactylosporangium sp. CA-092794]|uniref:hypothetical protein n=1 Tax=Dactylosporangium sp. CA-092794 TaxID=3239929 RepID=UPI003D93C051
MTSQPPHGSDPRRPGHPGSPDPAQPFGTRPTPGSPPPPGHAVPDTQPFGTRPIPGTPPPPFGPPQAAPIWPAPASARGGSGRPSRRGWYLVLAAGVLGVFVFCGIVVAAAGSGDRPTKTEDVARNGAIAAPPNEPPAASPTPAATGLPETTSAPAPATTAAPATVSTTAGNNAGANNGAGGGAGAGTRPATKPATTKPPTTKPPTTKPPTKAPAQNCNPNYTPCVPNDPVDVDCAGGSGNGPSYVQGPVHVIGSDPYKLDSDGDGIGCE